MAFYRFPSRLSLHLNITVVNAVVQKIAFAQKDRDLTLTVHGFPFPKLLDWLEAYASGNPVSFLLPMSFSSLSPFRQRVLQELQKIPFGKQMSYKQIAQAIENPDAARAVGNACRVNPFPLVIPCHRVIQSNGGMGKFAYDISCKRALLEYEENIVNEG